MKLTTKEVLPAARLLEQAKSSTLSEGEFTVTLKMANTICPILADAQKSEERIRESAKPRDWDEIVELIKKAKNASISKEEAERVNVAVKEYDGKVSKALDELLSEEHDINVELLPSGVPAKLMRENNWAFGVIAELKPITKEE